jgi:hypothetical protein
MDRRYAARLLSSLPLIAALGPSRLLAQGGAKGEAAQHPRIAAAIAAIQDAVDYMQHAPHDFGGHKAAAIEACRAAIQQLRQALAYRAAHD